MTSNHRFLSVKQCESTMAESARAQIPLKTATGLLAKLIQGLRNHSIYDTAQASRWIRCIVQIVLDQRSARILDSAQPVDDHEDLSMVRTVVEQAVLLARSAKSDRLGYPSEELEWLTTTLFNLSIDLYISSSSSTKADEPTNVMMPHFWASLAVEVADVLALDGPTTDTVTNGEGDTGTLARILRERCWSLGWDV